ncbi:MAG: ferrochelatase [Proteobacteria bacterium]|nr:ferrochelatase [Pseudomonadota bacterium]
MKVKKLISVMLAVVMIIGFGMTRLTMAAEAVTKEKIGLLMIGHGEPETFDEKAWSEGLHEMFKEFRESGMEEVPPDDAFPMIMEEIKQKYEKIGGRSRHAEFTRKEVAAVAKQLPGIDVRLGFNEFIGPSFTDIAEQMVKDGIKKLAVIVMLVTDSTHTGEVRNKLNALGLEKRGVKIVMGHPLFYRPETVQLQVQEIIKAAGKIPYDQVGVVLACHGEPDVWTNANRDNTRCKEQELALVACIKKGLLEKGFVWDNMVQGFNEFTKPELPAAVEKLGERNLKRVIVQPAFGTTDGTHISYDIPTKSRSALVDPSVELIVLPGWNENPLLIKAYLELAKDAIKQLK